MFDKKQIHTTHKLNQHMKKHNNQLSTINHRCPGVPQFCTPAALRLLLSAVRTYSYLLRATALRNTICSSSRPPTSISSSTPNSLWGLLKIAFVTKTSEISSAEGGTGQSETIYYAKRTQFAQDRNKRKLLFNKDLYK